MLKQLIFIIAGFIIGQGSMFLVQTYFVLNGHFELIANVGIALGVLSLMQWATDGGGVFILSKLEGEEGFNKVLPNYFIARLFFSGMFYLLILFLLLFAKLNETVQQVLYFIPVVIIFWSFNFTGIIDKLGKNNLVGPVSGLNWFFSSLVVVFYSESELFGLYLGAAFSFGLFATVILQFIVLKKYLNIKYEITLSSIKSCLYRICSYNLAYLTSQGNARFIPIFIDNTFSTAFAGMYIYAKNISNTISQLILFTRRIEFAQILVLVKKSKFTVFEFIKIQRYSFVAVFCILLLTVITYVIVIIFDIQEYKILVQLCTLMIMILCVWIVSSSFGQIFIAQDQLLTYGSIVAITNLTSVLTMITLVGRSSIYSVMIIELVMLLLQISIYSVCLKRLKH
ncbi:MAG: hypothetical protein GY928_39280 [Colwellia sp.]|nr:hypothetical protein [Colwellia sp.]